MTSEGTITKVRTHKERITRLRNGARRICQHPFRTARREAALARQAARDLRSPEEQLDVLDERNRYATRERAKLNRMIASQVTLV